jgi:K+-sensing histidine kinase KdpD
MLNFLHDIRNKITIINAHTSRLSKKYSDEEIMHIKTTVMRINDLVNDAYEQFSGSDSLRELSLGSNDETNVLQFAAKIEMLIEKIALSFSFEINNQINTTLLNLNSIIQYNPKLLIQVLENAFDNSLKADSSKIIIRVIENEACCIVELVDDGSGISPTAKFNPVHTVIPHGLGKKIMEENMKKMNGKVEWLPRMDGSGMIVRLLFPLTTQVTSLLGS